MSYSFFARGVCVAAPRRGRVSFWLHAHATKGHGVHSPFLYGFCCEVLLPLKHFMREKGYGKQGDKRHRHEEATDELLRLTEVYLARHYPHARVTLVDRPRRDPSSWDAWRTDYLHHTGGVVVDLYTWGLLFTLGGLAPHRVGIRGFQRFTYRG